MLMCQFWSRLLILPNEIICSQEVYLYYEKNYFELKNFYINQTMELFTRETIGNYTDDPYAMNDHKYSKEMQEIRKD